MQNKTGPAAPRRIFEDPVAWLLGPQLLNAVPGILLYTIYGAKIDPREWMSGKVFNLDDAARETQEEFWFDYLADTGDGGKAMYSLAYLTLCRSLWTRLNPTAADLPQEPADCEVSTTPNNPGFTFELPRGEFLFVGGDTAYHASDYLTLAKRIQRPFIYAFSDLLKNDLIAPDEPRRLIFGIPGNHDYYDQVDGFRRQFCKPTRPEGPLPPARSSAAHAQLTIPGFKRIQEASFVSLRLPFGWWLWGLDIESLINRRQRGFFRSLGQVNDDQFRPPAKLILATSIPSTVVGRAAKRDQTITRSLEFLGVSCPFLLQKDSAGNPIFQDSGDAKLKPGQCRLDLAGDVHHYARYWGPTAAGPCPRKRSSAPRPSSNSYASVVSGGGGAFHHPSTTYVNEICEQVLYPSEDKSRTAVTSQLFKFWTVMRGGYVWLGGFIIAFMVYLGAAGPQSSRQFISKIGFLQQLGLVNNELLEPVNASEWPPDFFWGTVFIFASLIAIAATFVLSVFTRKIFDEQNPFERRPDPHWKLWPIIIGTTLLAIKGFSGIYPYRYYIPPYVNSLLVVYSLFAALTAITISIRYREYLIKQSYITSRHGDWFLRWACAFIAIVVVGFVLLTFGQNTRLIYLISDILFTTVLLFVIFGSLILSFRVAGDLLYTKPKWIQITGKLLIGLWHLILQLFSAYVLIKTGSYLSWGLAAILLVLPIPLAQFFMKRNNGVVLAILWFIYGAVMLMLPWTVYRLSGQPAVFYHWTRSYALVPALIAGLSGAVICCLWTGWYFAVCFAFNGHNNEVGGTARIENFKQFIRFRLTPDSLTGYVIAVDDVSKIDTDDGKRQKHDGRVLKPRLIDVFQLRCK